ncbi:MAG: enoyl-CoA hydratase-related protein [Alphaproteobacteria bacterium]
MPAEPQREYFDVSSDLVLTEVDRRGVATVTINRADVNNAYNGDMIQGLLTAFGEIAKDAQARVVLLRGNGRHFQAGADLKWIMSLKEKSWEENLAVSEATTDAVRGLNEFPKPTIALVHGGCFGGGVGVASSCDIVIASEDAFFAITEAKWGLMAAPIYPQLIARLGVANTRRYSLTCERFDASKAKEIGLVDEVCPKGGLDEAAAPLVDQLLDCPPIALAETKASILECAGLVISDERAAELARPHAAKRLTDEATEGLNSFIEKRPPSWRPAA